MENAGPSGVKPRSWTRRSGSGLSCNGAYSRRSASALSDARSSAVAAKTTALQGAQHAKYTMSPGRATGQEDAHALNARPATPTQLTPVIASLVRCRDRPLGRTNSRTRGCDGKATVTALSNNAEPDTTYQQQATNHSNHAKHWAARLHTRMFHTSTQSGQFAREGVDLKQVTGQPSNSVSPRTRYSTRSTRRVQPHNQDVYTSATTRTAETRWAQETDRLCPDSTSAET
jgi:hypothetical protein